MNFKKIFLKVFSSLPIVLAGIALTTIVALESAQAFYRYIFHRTFLFVDDIAVVCFAWTIFAGCAAAYQHKLHYGLDVLTNALKGRTKTIFMIVVQILTALMFGYFLYYGVMLYVNVGPKILTTTHLSYRWIDGALVYGFAMMLIYNIKFLIEDIKSLKASHKEEETV